MRILMSDTLGAVDRCYLIGQMYDVPEQLGEEWVRKGLARLPDEPRYDSRTDTYAHIQQVQGLVGKVVRDLLGRSERHDQSKLADPELATFNEFTPKLKTSTYGSDEYKSFLAAMKPALDHHYANCRHHPESFAFRPDGTLDADRVKDGSAIRSMSLLDLTEMVCDWLAASARHATGDVRKSIEINQARFGYSDELKAILLNTLPALGVPPIKEDASSGSA